MSVYPAGDRALQVACCRDHRILGIAVAREQPHLVKAVVAHVEADRDEQRPADPVDVGHDSAHPVQATAELVIAAATASAPTTSVKPAA